MLIRASLLFLFTSVNAYALLIYEISGSPYSTQDAPLPSYIKTHKEKVIIIDPISHAFGAYDVFGKLKRWGIATAGANWCSDIRRPCKTDSGTFRIYSLGDANCISHRFPYPEGGAQMPYCMYFNGSQALHGSYEVTYGNVSHGCIRIHVNDAKWLRFHFVERPSVKNNYRGTKVIIKSY